MHQRTKISSIVLALAAVGVALSVAPTSSANSLLACNFDQPKLDALAVTRAIMGLRADIEHITNVSCREDNEADSYLGIPLDEQESVEMMRRDACPLAR